MFLWDHSLRLFTFEITPYRPGLSDSGIHKVGKIEIFRHSEVRDALTLALCLQRYYPLNRGLSQVRASVKQDGGYNSEWVKPISVFGIFDADFN